MGPQCERAQQELVWSGGRIEELPADLQRHVAGCSTCRAIAQAELELQHAFKRLIPEADAGSVAGLVSKLPERRWRRPAWLPVSVAGGIVAAALLSLGGFPGETVTGVFPEVTGQAGLDIASHIASQLAVAPHVLADISRAIPAALGIGAAVTSVGAFLILARALARLRRELG